MVTGNWPLTQRSKNTRPLYNFEIKHVTRRAKSIRDLVVRSKLDFHPETNIGTKVRKEELKGLCADKRCSVCPLLDRKGKIKSKCNKNKYTAKYNINCRSSNLIYCIKCRKCKKDYVGQTKRSLKDRINEHITSVKRRHLKTDVSRHFCGDNHEGVSDMEVYVLDFIYKDANSQRTEVLRKTIEFNWIQRLQTQTPTGMNILDSDYG